MTSEIKRDAKYIIPHGNATLRVGYKGIVLMLDAALADNDIKMGFLKGLKSEWKDKAEDTFIGQDEEHDLRENIMARLFNEIEYWEKEKS